MSDRIAAKIRYVRALHGFTQLQLADELGVGLRTVQGWEEGEHDPSLRYIATLERLAQKPRGWLLLDLDDDERGSATFGTTTLGVIASVATAFLLLLSPNPSGHRVSCRCPVTFNGRQPRVRLASPRRRTIPGRGRIVLPDV